MATDPLVLEFVATRPDDVSALLATCELGELAAFVGALPVAAAAALCARLPSWQLTGLLGTLEAQFIAQMLVSAPGDEAVALSAHLHESRYQAVIAAAPEAQRVILYQMLQFPAHTLASLAGNAFIRVSADTTCKLFCEQLSENADTSPQPILVIDGDGRYNGMLSLRAAYARKNRGRPVGQVAERVEPLSGLTDAATALGSRLWGDRAELPVVDRHHRILGVVSRAALERVAGESRPGEFGLEKVVSELATGYLNTCGRVLESLLGRP
ncbi:hypothetical protein [Haliea sp. E17]|uniref:hypothetical protein n=1 Tax=Haliea sp. E17 TaxID=3401576 RepID=UPI003AACDC8E